MTRPRHTLDGTWSFAPDPRGELAADHLPDELLRPIRVPGPWQAQFDDLRDYAGVAWYRTRFTVPAASELPLEDTECVLRFGAVDYHAAIWIDGTRIGDHEGGYLPFEVVVPRAGDATEHELVVRVVDPGTDTDWPPEFPFAEIPHGKQSWYGPIGGIWQSVTVERRHCEHLRRVRITPDVPGAQARVEVPFSKALTEPRTLALTLTDPEGRTLSQRVALEAGQEAADVLLPVNPVILWDVTSPLLYRLEAALETPEGRVLDSIADTFGMRTIATSPSGHLLLNDRILYLRGALDQDYYPDLIYTPFSDEELDRQFAMAKHMGLNCLRTHIKITDPRYYYAADRAGILIWTELPNWQELTDEAKARARETLLGMVERDWNHPAIVIWTIVNENWGLDLAVNSAHREWLAEMYRELKVVDPHRLVVGNSPCFGNFHVVTDIEDFHNYYHIPDHYRRWQDWVQRFASRPPWTFASNYSSIDDWRAYLRDPWNTSPRPLAPEAQRRGSEPMVVSEFGNWGLPDVQKLRECYGGREPWWFETGIEWGDGVAYPHGIEQRFRAYHIDRVFPTLADLAHASQRMQYTALKYQIEQMRRYPAIVGYIITEFTDVHWEANGLLDICRNPKAFHDVIGQINGADAIVPIDWERIAYWTGERVEIRLALSHFSSADVRGARVEWHVDRWPELAGTLEAGSLARASLTTLGTIVFDVPDVAESARVRVEFRLVDQGGNVIAHNHHELYVFPRLPAPPPMLDVSAPGSPRLAAHLAAVGYRMTDDWRNADVVVTERMTDELRAFVQQGGRVLWLAESSDSLATHLGPLGIAQRETRSWQGDWASSMSWIRQDRIFGGIPTGGVVDFAFADLTPEAVIVGLSPRDFAGRVHSGLFVGWVHHVVALVAERAVDRGLVMICTYRLREHLGAHPVATIMMRDLLLRTAGAVAAGRSAVRAADLAGRT